MLRSALGAAQIPISSHYIVMASDLFEWCMPPPIVSLPQPIVCLAKLLSGYISMPKVSLDTIGSFISRISSCTSGADTEPRASYRMAVGLLSLQCHTNHRLMTLLEAISSVIGKSELGLGFTGKNALEALRTFLGIEFWGTKVLLAVAPRLPAFVYLLSPNPCSNAVHKLASISIIGPVIDNTSTRDLELTGPHINCSAPILLEVLTSVCLPCIHCPRWVEMFYEQFYATDCRGLVPLNTKGWGFSPP